MNINNRQVSGRLKFSSYFGSHSELLGKFGLGSNIYGSIVYIDKREIWEFSAISNNTLSHKNTDLCYAGMYGLKPILAFAAYLAVNILKKNQLDC